jgi:putative salt-induced outer membrane protein YdiY
MPRLTLVLSLVVGLVAVWATPSFADEVLFLNGDRLTGKIQSATGGKLTIKTEGAGDVTVDLSKVKTFSTDEPVRVGRKGAEDEPPVTSRVAAGPDRQVEASPAPGAPPQPVPITDIAVINPPLPAWKGALSLNGLLTTGNSQTEQLGFLANAAKRWPRDRLTLGAEYSYGRQEDPDTGEKSTTINYAMALAKYDHFFTKKFYGYLNFKAEHDEVAELEVRLAPGVGVGYQWYEGPKFNLLTETGVSWVYENFKHAPSHEFVAARLAYAVDWTPIDPLYLYHKLEYLPAFEDPGGDYLLNADAGVRLGVWKALFAEFRYELRYDSRPAPGRDTTDQRFILGAGWSF